MGIPTRFYSFVLVLLLFSSCSKEFCFDMPKETRWIQEISAWKFEDFSQKKALNLQNNIQQTFEIKEDSPISVGNSTDDCGNELPRYKYDYKYNTSLSPIDFRVQLEVSSSQIEESKLTMSGGAQYSFVARAGKQAEYLEQKELNGIIYKDIIHFQPAENQQNKGDYAITSAYYVKGKGIVQFTVKKGFTYQVK